MRILGLLALCLSSAVALSATGQSTQTAAPALGKQAPSQNTSAQPAAQNADTAIGSAQATLQQDSTGQTAQAQKPGMKFDWPPMSMPAQKPGTQRNWPQMSFDKGIYAGRNTLTGSRTCLAIQSYNFSQAAPGKMPKLESITTCSTIQQPLMRNVRKPESRNQQDQDHQQDRDKDQK